MSSDHRDSAYRRRSRTLGASPTSTNSNGRVGSSSSSSSNYNNDDSVNSPDRMRNCLRRRVGPGPDDPEEDGEGGHEDGPSCRRSGAAQHPLGMPWTWTFHRRWIGPFGSDSNDNSVNDSGNDVDDGDRRPAAPPSSEAQGRRRGDDRGRHYTDSFAECVEVVRALEALHKRRCVHGNIRALNVVFGGATTAGSQLIDFDFGGTVNRAADGGASVPTYPLGYEPALRDGMRPGEAGRPVTTYDDWYALQMVLTHVHEIVPRAPCAIHADALDATISQLEDCDIDPPPDGCFKKLSELKRNIADLEDCGGGGASYVDELTQKGGGGIEGGPSGGGRSPGVPHRPHTHVPELPRKRRLAVPGHDDGDGEAGRRSERAIRRRDVPISRSAPSNSTHSFVCFP
jgi:hypothetical protein